MQEKVGSPILVSGLINIETTLRVEGFPIEYAPVTYPFFGVRSSVSGVGYNLAKALTTLGDEVRFLSLLGEDLAGQTARAAMAREGVPTDYVVQCIHQTPQSAILFDGMGRRMVHTDLKDIQEQGYPAASFEEALAGCEIAALCNVNFSRPFLARARQAGKVVATDVHTIADLDDPYNRDFMAAADILFMSDERLPTSPEAWAWRVMERYGPAILVIGLGAEGALLAVRDDRYMKRLPVIHARPVVNTIGAGDALFASFLHSYNRSRNPYEAIQKAMLFASYKVGIGGSDGFLDAPALEALYQQVGAEIGDWRLEIRCLRNNWKFFLCVLCVLCGKTMSSLISISTLQSPPPPTRRRPASRCAGARRGGRCG